MRPLITLLMVTYHLAVNSQASYNDTWLNPIVLCSNHDFTLDNFGPVKAIESNEFDSCIKPFENLSKVWLKFVIENESQLAFTITPQNITDDIDFALFKSNHGVPGELERCMATGLLLDRSSSIQAQCTGETGLANFDSDKFEDSGCSLKQNNFLQDVNSKADDEYYLLITNYRSENGFNLRFTGNSMIDTKTCSKNSQTISVTFKPNPARDILGFTITSRSELTGQYHLVNKQGFILENQDIQLVLGNNDFQIPIQSIPSGDYFLSIFTPNGQVVEKVEIIK